MSKFFKNIKVGIIEEVNNKDVIDMMSRYPEVYQEVSDPTKKPAEKAEKKAEKAEEAEAPKAEAKK